MTCVYKLRAVVRGANGKAGLIVSSRGLKARTLRGARAEADACFRGGQPELSNMLEIVDQFGEVVMARPVQGTGPVRSRWIPSGPLHATGPDAEARLLNAWIGQFHSAQTRRNCQLQADRFLAYIARPLAELESDDVDGFLATLEARPAAARASATATLRSLLKFTEETGYLHLDLGQVLKAPQVSGIGPADEREDGMPAHLIQAALPGAKASKAAQSRRAPRPRHAGSKEFWQVVPRRSQGQLPPREKRSEMRNH